MKVPDGKPPLSVFVGPSTIEEHERRLRAWLTESEASLDAMMADAARVKAEGDAERLFDAEIALDGDPAKALDALVNLVSAERPDVVAPKNPEADLAKIPKPIVVCGPSGVGKTSLITMLTEEHPDAFGVVVRHTAARRPRARKTGRTTTSSTTRRSRRTSPRENSSNTSRAAVTRSKTRRRRRNPRGTRWNRLGTRRNSRNSRNPRDPRRRAGRLEKRSRR